MLQLPLPLLFQLFFWALRQIPVILKDEELN